MCVPPGGTAWFRGDSFSLRSAAVLRKQCECHSRISDEEVGPDLVDGSGGASVPQQKAEQIAGGRCLTLLRLLLWPRRRRRCRHQLEAPGRSRCSWRADWRSPRCCSASLFLFIFFAFCCYLEGSVTSGDLWPWQRGAAHTLPPVPSVGM